MSAPSRALRGLFLAAVAVVSLFTLTRHWDGPKPNGIPFEEDGRLQVAAAHAGVGPGELWTWNATRDRNNHYLTDDQCTQAFPLLYKEIDRAAEFWMARQDRITPENIDLSWSYDGGLRCMIYDQQLYIVYSRGLNHFGHWIERHRGTLSMIHRAILTAPEPVPNIEFTIRINDDVAITDEYPDITFWAFSRNVHNPIHDQLWIIPDFNWWAYPRVSGSIADFQRRALDVGQDFASKIPKLVWRGTIDFNSAVRIPLLKQSEGMPWSDVARVDEDVDGQPKRITIEDHCKYKYAVHTEGTTWSGRLKYLLSCNTVVFAHPLSYYTHIYHLLKPSGPSQNFVSVKPEWEDLHERVQELLDDDDKGSRIAANAAAVFRDRYGTAAAQTCYFRRLFQVWREVSFEPNPYTYVRDDDGNTVKTWKAMTYEEYMIIHDGGDVHADKARATD